jgi:hypothetical protein
MRRLAKILVLSFAAATLAAPALAAPMGGGGGWSGGGGGILPQGGGPPEVGAGAGPGPGGHVPSIGPAPRWQAAPSGGFVQLGKPAGWVSGKPPVGDIWHHHHQWPGGPIFIPDGGDFSYIGDYYYDETDADHCWVYRRAYDRAGHFLGFVHVNLCEGQ